MRGSWFSRCGLPPVSSTSHPGAAASSSNVTIPLQNMSHATGCV
jgi:hypothetical protein